MRTFYPPYHQHEPILAWGRKNKYRLSRLLPIFLAAWVCIICQASVVSGNQSSDIADQDIMFAIEERLSKDEGVAAHHIDVIVKNGIVMATGTVDNLLAKERITQLASTFKGVRAVVNRIQVAPRRSSTDSEIKDHVEQALLDNPATELLDLHVSVQDGIVTLQGTVQSWQEQQLSLTVAKGVQGVRDTIERVQLATIPNRSDRALTHEIAQRLRYDVWIPHDSINVHVRNGKATLSGVVHSVEEKNRAGRLAWVFGITSVNTDGLQVNWEKQDPMQKSGLTQVPDDDIRQAIDQALTYDPRLSSSNIEIEVNHGTITLTGIVSNLAAKAVAEHNAKNTVGVYRVMNFLKVRPSPPATDASIENQVKAAMQRDPFLNQEALDVSVHEGRVYLEGKVPTTFRKSRAEFLASRVKGVVEVINRVHHPFRWLWKSDWEIKRDIRNALQWDSHLAPASIQVHVENGQVTLRGTVQNKEQSQLAKHIALEMGARSVRNKLETPPLH
ncbi:BON domain-containing protein [Candidatus Nitronereus thalassa]|uniref:BON domain-containing protein n=1 Tax=Candidatus Nitronereus thalassa TaxID=3020898 RepID=A0ABU3KBP9_9BACT|nr:BON domain-containing protein [Candidatus Nitronereus thalassa]MDT7043723.1 BON domain-containing protein [Candidatus Nitronereus thalassa]